MPHAQSQFDASASSLGYLYQIRFALYMALKRLRDVPDLLISVEKIDDVAFDTRALILERFQTKFHLSRRGDLSDKSVDVWKTVRVWAESLRDGNLDAKREILTLVTTGIAPPQSAASYLGPTNREVEKALRLLEAAARESSNLATKPGRESFLGLPAEQRQSLVSAIFVTDSAAMLPDLVDKIKAELRFGARREFLNSLYSQVEGWWLQRVATHLESTDPSDRIQGAELETQILEFAEQYHKDNLPVDRFVAVEGGGQISPSEGRVFVRQLQFLSLSATRIRSAISDHQRAFANRSFWLRHKLVGLSELPEYEQRLVEEWGRVFELNAETIDASATETARVAAGKEVYKWVEQTAAFLDALRIRPKCSEPFLTRGSYHLLADALKVGWHPDFREKCTDAGSRTLAENTK